MAEDDIARLLEACYAELQEGREPDLDALCAGAPPELRSRVERIVSRERLLVEGAAAPRAKEPVSRVALGRGARLGDFELLEEIGSGGMGRVFRARQISLSRDVALKVLRDDIGNSESSRARFQREALVTAGLDHENIVPVYQTGHVDGETYIAMRLIRGRALDQHPLPFDAKRAAGIAAAIARAAHAAHEVGVLHRDLKPANVLLEGDTPYVVDFGLARLSSSTTRLTEGDATPGALAYMAPECLRGRSPIFDPRIDVYGLGATLYEALSGRPPFRSEIQIRLLREVLYEDPAPLRLPGRDRDLETIAMRALQKSPADRFPTAQAMAEELDRYLRDDAIESRPIGSFGRYWRRARRRPFTTAAIAIATMVIVTLLSYLMVMQQREEDRREATLSAIEQSFGKADLSAASRDLDSLRAQREDSAVVEVGRALQRELDLRMVTLLVQSPTIHANLTLIAPLMERLRDSDDARLRLVKAAIAAIEAPDKGSRLDDELSADFPRTDAVREAIANDRDPLAALKACRDSGSATDRLFAALLLRLHGASIRNIEAELRRADTMGPDGLAVHFARSIALEGLSEHRAAFLELGAVYASEHTRTVAACVMARLSATLGYDDSRARLVGARRMIGDNAPDYARAFLVSSELQIARDRGSNVEHFWQTWRDSEELLGSNQSYWMLAANFALACEDTERASEVAHAGLQKIGSGPKTLSLSSLALQVDWAATPFATESEPLDEEALDEARPVIEGLAGRAHAVLTEARRSGSTRVASEALLVLYRCSRALGDRRRAWDYLEEACNVRSSSEAFTSYSRLVAYRIINRHLIGSIADEDTAEGGPLAIASRIGCERARAVMELAAAGDPAAFALHAQAKSAYLACAFHCGDAAHALRLAEEVLRADLEPDDPMTDFAPRVVEWAGLPLDVLVEDLEDAPHVASRLHKAIAELEAGRSPRERREAVLRLWLDALPRTAADEDPAWTDARLAMEQALERASKPLEKTDENAGSKNAGSDKKR